MRKHVLVWGLTCVSLSACSDLAWLDEALERERRLRVSEDGGTSWPADAAGSDRRPNADDGPRDEHREGGANGSETADGSGASSDGPGNLGDGSQEAPACAPDESPTEGDAVYVAPGPGSGDGSAARPLSSVAAALLQAATTRARVIYVEVGIYEEPALTIAGDVEIRGGFQRAGGLWKRLCDRDVPTRPTIKVRAQPLATSNVGVTITGGNVLLADLVIANDNGGTGASGEGQSTFAAWVSGSSTILRLTRTRLVAGKGGAGATVEGQDEAPPASCTGISDCLAADADPGTAGPAGEHGALGRPGKFSSDGFHPGLPTGGKPGAPGRNGRAGQPGASATCVSSCDIEDRSRCECRKASATIAAARGTCGCGGRGGAAGRPGHAGGASVALFVGAGASLVLQGAELVAGDGGRGTAGTEGGEGQLGTAGAPGANRACFVNCSPPNICSATAVCVQATPSATPLIGGAAGGDGGRGGRGGRGGAAAGGPSHALVTQHGVVTLGLDTASLSVGAGGEGGASGLTGASSPTLLDP